MFICGAMETRKGRSGTLKVTDESKRNGPGTCSYTDINVVYKGKWENDIPVGEGEFEHEDVNGKTRVERVVDGFLKIDETGINSVPPTLPPIKLFL